MVCVFPPSEARQRQQQHSYGAYRMKTATAKPRSSKPMPEEFGLFRHDNLSLLSDQATLRAELGDLTPIKIAKPDSDSDGEGLTPRHISSGGRGENDQPNSSHSPTDAGGAAVYDAEAARHAPDGASPCVSDGCSAGEPGVSAAANSGRGDPAHTAAKASKAQRGRGKKRKGGGALYAELIGKELDVPAAIFDIQVPDLFYRAVVKKRDPARKHAVVIRFPEDGSTFWLPAAEVRQYIVDTEARHGEGDQSLAGKGSTTFAAEVLVSLSGAGGSSATQQSSPPGHTGHHAASGEVESAMQMPARKKQR